MRVFFLLSKRFSAAPNPVSFTRRTFTSCTRGMIEFQPSILVSPWSVTQLRCARFTGSDVKTGNIIERREIHVQDMTLTYSYTDDETGNIVLMDPETYSQLEIPKHFFGKSIVYLQDDMNVKVQMYDERPVSASVPSRVTCKVAEASDAVKGSRGPRYKKVLLDNGETVDEVPAHIVAGDEIIIDTTKGHYISKA
ncbi:hypothetical protein ACJIZ3_017666 [Penstemon smallii]|uniref:Elongation factor P n=1 Tax=Penstemon smallii TaxID=265156 RepID=A0ABD3SW77_9LAMI